MTNKEAKGSELKVEFGVWDTPFMDGDITILDVSYLDGELSNEYGDERVRFSLPPTRNLGSASLVVRLFHKEDRSVYALSFKDVGAFRVLDEHGLLDVWAASDERPRPNQSTFMVRNHRWSEDSMLSFVNFADDGWSYLIATDFDCVEVVCSQPPKIKLEQTVPAEELPKNRGKMAALLETCGSVLTRHRRA